jgi:hypothetical protein
LCQTKLVKMHVTVFFIRGVRVLLSTVAKTIVSRNAEA